MKQQDLEEKLKEKGFHLTITHYHDKTIYMACGNSVNDYFDIILGVLKPKESPNYHEMLDIFWDELI